MFNIVTKRKKILFLIFIGLVFIITFSIYFYVNYSDNLLRSSEDTEYRFTAVPKVPECRATDTIEYMYYEDKDMNWEQNNKFGIYVYAENRDFFELAQNLVNSRGGDWGYVLIPFNVKDTDEGKWRRVFEQLSSKHLIPVIQLWDIDVDDYEDQTEDAAKFLNKFVWPIRYRYISAYNEMNDAKFWYGKIDPEGYAKILDYTVKVFKEENPNFMVMNGAFNVSAPNNDVHMDSFDYMYKMNQSVPGIFNKLDAWASHPYPQPNFAGNPYTWGRWGIRAYEDELNYLKNNLDLEKELPVFITETGWAHAEGDSYNSSYLPADTVAEFFKIAFEEVWLKDDKVRAVMPFTIRYDPPFDHFSWVNKDNVPYKQFDVVKSIKKIKGDPPKLVTESFSIESCD